MVVVIIVCRVRGRQNKTYLRFSSCVGRRTDSGAAGGGHDHETDAGVAEVSCRI